MKKKLLFLLFAFIVCAALFSATVLATESTESETTETLTWYQDETYSSSCTSKFSWTYDPVTYTMTFNPIGTTTAISSQRATYKNDSGVTVKSANGAFAAWKSANSTYVNAVKHIVVSDSITEIVYQHSQSILANWPNVESIYLGGVRTISSTYSQSGSTTGTGGLFGRDYALTTVWGKGQEKQENVINLSALYFSKSESASSAYNMKYMLYNCDGATTVIFPRGSVDKKISQSMFSQCDNLVTVEIPDWVTSIANFGFYNCLSLTNIVIPETVTSIGEEAFYATNLESITFPKSVETISADALEKCTNLKTITIENPALVIPEGFTLSANANGEKITVNCASYAQYQAINALGVDNTEAVFEIPANNLMSDGSGYQYSYSNGVFTFEKIEETASTVLSTDLTFDFMSLVKTIIIPEDTGVTEIGANMFDGFAAETVVVPSTLKTVSSKAFANMPNLKTVVDHTAYTADATAGTGVINIMTVTSVASDAFSGSCAALTPVVYMGKTVAVSGETFDWFSEDAAETICVYPSTDATAFFRKNSIAFQYLTVEQTGDAFLAREYGTSTGTHTWSIDEMTGKLTFTRTDGNAISISGDTTSWINWKAVWADAIESFYVNMSHWRIYYQKVNSPFSNLPNLKHVHFSYSSLRLDRSKNNTNGLFQNCPKLTTVSYGSDDTYDEEIDLTCWSLQNYYMSYMFKDCKSIKKVILPTDLKAGTDGVNLSITTSFFDGCESLTEVEIPACFTAFGKNAFANCPNLTYVNILGELPNGVNAEAFPDREGLVIDVTSYLVADKFINCGFTKTVLNYPFAGVVTMDGFSVRLSGYNGLRGLFSADFSAIDTLKTEGYELLEFGSLVSSAANRANCVLTVDDNGNYIVSADKIIKSEIWNSAEGQKGKYLSTTTEEKIDFAITVIKFTEELYLSDVYFCAYEIWKTPDNETVIYYKDYKGTDYDEISLFDICNEMWEDGTVNEDIDSEGIVKAILDYYDDHRTKNILFIGNSFTYYNNMPTAIFPVIAEAADRNVNITAITNGGHTLAEFSDSSDSYGAKVAAAFAETEFDYVILQEQSHRPISNPESFYSAVRSLKEMARQNGAETYLYATWGYDADHTSLATYGKDTAEMEMKLRAAYTYIGEELNIPVCHVGAAMTYAFTNSDVSLYNSDNYHPLTSASTLAALTIFSTIYDVDPAGLSFSIDGVTESEMAVIRSASSYVYNGDMSIPEEYQTASAKPLDGKRIIFIGNSHIYYGTTVLYKNPETVLTQEARMNDQGLFYQLCKANGMNVNVTNWTFANHILADLFGDRLCDGSGYDCVDVDHSSYLVDPYYDYVVACYGTFNSTTHETAIDNMIEFFTKANPNVKISLMAQASAHGVSVTNPEKDTNFLNTLKDYAARGITIIDWGKLIADIISGEVAVPGATLDYVKNTFVVDQSATDGFHPNLLTGYLTTLMTYSALTGEKAVGQPYYFVGDDSYCSNSYYRTFEEYKAKYYTYNNATTNFDQVFASENDMTGLQTLVDQYLADKAYEDYDFKKIIFIGDSFIYWGNTVLDKGYSSEAKIKNSLRRYDTGLFYQLCKANGMDVNVVNWTFGSHGIGSIMNENGCGVSDSCPCYEGKSHMSYLTETDFDYVVISGGRNSASSYESYVKYLTYYKDYFTATNPNVKMFYLVSSGAHNVSVAESFPVEILNNLDEFEKIGYTIIDWGKLVKDLIDGTAVVPNSTVEYNKNSFVVSRSSSDGYHPNQLAGYITTLMTYCAIFGESAVGQPYSFVGDTSLSPESNYYSFEDYISTYYTYDGATTNYDKIFASEADMKGIQTLIDQYLADKAYKNYNFTATE